MNPSRELVTKKLMGLLQSFSPSYADYLFYIAVVIWIALCAVVLHFILRKVIVKTLKNLHFLNRSGGWFNSLYKHNLIYYILSIAQAILVQVQVKSWLSEDLIITKFLISTAELSILFFGLLSLFALLNTFQSIMSAKKSRFSIPFRGVIQTSKLILSVLFVLLAVAIILGKSILVLLSGIGAISAVLMLVFRDPILGLAAGIQLSLNDMLAIGDWLEMPKYDADGDVIDIGLTTVKVKNWDKTITTIPTYALISNSFKNWRGMSDSGARRIKRSLLINTTSIRFLNEEDIASLKKSNLLSNYLEEKHEEIQVANKSLNTDLTCLINGRRMTNVGTFRSYLDSYLKAHKKIRQDMTLMVRQLESTSHGLPIEIYAFSATTVWAEYESIQADIFDHIFAIIGEFGLVIHESPTGRDINQLNLGSDKQQQTKY